MDINLVVGFGGLLVAIISIWLAYYFDRRSSRVGELTAAFSEPTILRLEDELQVNGTKAKVLSVLEVTITNTGTEPLELSQIKPLLSKLATA